LGAGKRVENRVEQKRMRVAVIVLEAKLRDVVHRRYESTGR
jgi:hypothetical protein